MTTDGALVRLRAARVEAHGLASGLSTPRAAVERLGCVQAQDFAASKWVLGARVPGSAEADVDRMIEIDRTAVRSWPMRGTLHLVAADLLRPLLSLTAARQLARAAARHRALGIDDDVVGAAREVAEHALAGGRALARTELQDAWEAAGISTAGQRGYHLIWRLAVLGVLCQGPIESRSRQRFVLLDEWLPRATSSLDADEALGILFARYARGHGPVTVRDFAWWTGLTLTHARTALANAGDRVVPFDDTRFVAADAPIPAAGARSVALAAFDEYYLGYGDRSPVCPPEHAGRLVPGGNGMFLPVLVADGAAVGTWRPAAPGRARTGVALHGFDRPPRGVDFRASLSAWAAFWGTTLGEITTE